MSLCSEVPASLATLASYPLVAYTAVADSSVRAICEVAIGSPPPVAASTLS